MDDHREQGASLGAQMVKNSPAIWETWLWSPGQKDPLREGNGSPFHYSCLENSMDRGVELGGWFQSIGSQREGHNWMTFTHSPSGENVHQSYPSPVFLELCRTLCLAGYLNTHVYMFWIYMQKLPHISNFLIHLKNTIMCQTQCWTNKIQWLFLLHTEC